MSGQSNSSLELSTSPNSAAASAVAAAQNSAAAQSASSSSNNSASSSASLTPNPPPGFPFSMPSLFSMQHFQHAQAAHAAAMQAAAENEPKTKKQKQQQQQQQLNPALPSMTQAQLTQQFHQMAAAAGGTQPVTPFFPGYAALNGSLNNANNNNAGASSNPPLLRGRWNEPMTRRLIELRSKMEARFNTVARPDKLWLELTEILSSEFGATLPKQSTRDKWKNLRSSYRQISQGKHPSHYNKETWPFWPQMDAYCQQHDKRPDGSGGGPMIPILPNMMDQMIDGGLNESKMGNDGEENDEDDGDQDDGDDDEGDGDFTEGEEDSAGRKKDGKRGKKRDRSDQGVQQPTSMSQAASQYYATAAAIAAAGGIAAANPAALAALQQPRDAAPRRNRDLAASVRALNAHMVLSIQESHQSLLQMTKSYAEIADRLAPIAGRARNRNEAATQHAARLVNVSMEVEVTRAELKHLTLLTQLFDQYRVFYSQPSDPEAAAHFLNERLTKNQSVIFIALAVNPASGDPLGSSSSTSHLNSSSSSSSSVDPSLTHEENMHARNLTSNMNIHYGATTTMIGTAARSNAPRLPTYACGFAQLYPSYSSVRLGRHWILNDLFVHPSVRSRGIAGLLLSHVKKFAQDSGAVGLELSTAVTNTSAQKLYTRMGWKRDNEYVVFHCDLVVPERINQQ